MDEPVLTEQNPFEGMLLPLVAGVTLAPSPIRHRLVFQVDESKLKQRIGKAGLTAIPPVLRAKIADRFSLLRPCPDEWLLLGEGAFAPEVREIAGSGAIEISHGYAGIVWRGPRATLALSAGCPLDLHESAFPVGMATRTLYGKCEVLLWRQDSACFHMEVARSYLTAILAFFAETARRIPES
jgi:sarcosine oxidase subunit gamma